jgi:hypothetical protein
MGTANPPPLKLWQPSACPPEAGTLINANYKEYLHLFLYLLITSLFFVPLRVLRGLTFFSFNLTFKT